MPGWPVNVFISGEGHAYHRTPFCPLLMAGQMKSRERGHVVRPIKCLPRLEAKERRRTPCQGCLAIEIERARGSHQQ